MNLKLPKTNSRDPSHSLGTTSKIRHLISLFYNHINGNNAYQSYLQHCGRNNPLSKKDFLRQREKSKWTKISRCC